MRITKEQARENRERVIAAAAEMFRARGFDGVGVADLMKAAGFTHGGFYNHFESKDALSVEAVRSAFEQMAAERARHPDLADMLSRYLSATSRKAPGRSCPAAALGGDVARQPEPVRAEFASGVGGMVADFAARLSAAGVADAAEARGRAVALVAQMVGGLMLARAAPDNHPLAQEMLESCLRAGLEAPTR